MRCFALMNAVASLLQTCSLAWTSPGDPRGSPMSEAPQVPGSQPKLLDPVRSAIRVRHYSRRTEVAYVTWVYKNRVDGRDEHSTIASSNRLQYVPLAYAEQWKRQQRSASEEDDRRLFEQGLRIVRELQNTGVTILAGTDVGTAFQVPGISLHDELSLLVKAGLSEMDALQAATRNPARTVGLANQGTIEKGMRADLVLLDGNPLVSIENIRQIRAVIANGRLLERGELDQMLADVQKSARDWRGTPTR
jgi:Amidohydrolase family